MTTAQEVYDRNHHKAGSWMMLRNMLLQTNTPSREMHGGIIFTFKDTSELLFKYGEGKDWFVWEEVSNEKD